MDSNASSSDGDIVESSRAILFDMDGAAAPTPPSPQHHSHRSEEERVVDRLWSLRAVPSVSHPALSACFWHRFQNQIALSIITSAILHQIQRDKMEWVAIGISTAASRWLGRGGGCYRSGRGWRVIRLNRGVR